MAESRPGNQDVASDLYGNGIRVGLYLQTIGMLLTSIRGKSRGIKLTSGAFLIAILASWSNLARKQEISPAESVIILGLANIMFITSGHSFGHPNAIVGEGLAMTALVISFVWFTVVFFLFWGRLCFTLPDLDTPGKTWFFVKVDISGWFRILALVQGSILIPIPVIVIMGIAVILILSSYDAWRSGDPDDFEIENENIAVTASRWAGAVGAISWILTVANVEMTIRWNELTPQSDVSQPGQIIPLVVGIFVFVDGFLSIFTPAQS
jgi:hypothetical protein